MTYRTGMFVYALAFLLGVVFVQQLATLPDIWPILLLFSSIFVHFLLFQNHFTKCKFRISKSYITFLFLIIYLIILGIMYSCFYAKNQLGSTFDEALMGRDIVISGKISSVPINNGKARRFEMDVDRYRVLTAENVNEPLQKVLSDFPNKLRLSWYYGRHVNAGETWQLEVRLKPPHGFMNPGGFDYEGWLFQQGIQGTGYIRKSEFNQRLNVASTWSIDGLRQSLSQTIDVIASEAIASDATVTEQNTGIDSRPIASSFALVKALAIGDKSSLSSKQWQILANTGTSHLMAISGLHIGLAALFAYVLARRLLPVATMKRVPAQHVALIISMLAAVMYALIAGLSIPTQRAIIMLFTLSVMTLIRRNVRPVDSLGLAMLLVLLADPSSVLSAGFWFSFSAVAVIYLSLMTQTKKALDTSFLVKLGTILWQWIRLQLMISILLLPLSLFMFQQASLISPLANLLLIPYVSFLVVPVILLAIISTFVAPDIAVMLFTLASILLDWIWPVLSTLSEQPYAFWVRGDVDIVELLMVTTAILVLIFSRQISQFISHYLHNKVEDKLKLNKQQEIYLPTYFSILTVGGLLFVPLFIANKPALATGDYQLTILDVGQGSASVIQTQNHVMVFDTGAKFSEKMDAGNSVVIPYLRSQGIKNLDRIIVSHGDSDHIGGAQAVIDSYPGAEVIGQDLQNLVLHENAPTSKKPCIAGKQWQWDGVNFEFLSPSLQEINAELLSKSGKRNNHSCVLAISSESGSVLLTGDIEKQAEKKLVQQYNQQLQADILIVPHHGSKTSSSQPFIDMINPKISVISVGYRNRYKLPSSKVVSRYRALGGELIQTNISGAIIIKLLKERGILVDRYREIARKYWHHQ